MGDRSQNSIFVIASDRRERGDLPMCNKGTVAECHFYCKVRILAATLQKFFARYCVYASKFLLRLAQNSYLSLRKRIRQQAHKL